MEFPQLFNNFACLLNNNFTCLLRQGLNLNFDGDNNDFRMSDGVDLHDIIAFAIRDTSIYHSQSKQINKMHKLKLL
jgi:hypothetical protein